MDVREFFIYLLIMSGSTYLIRAIPFIAIRKKINNKFIKSFLYYIPYTVLASMTFPASLYVTGHIISSIIGLLFSAILALKNKSLTVVAIGSCVGVLITECILLLF